MANTLSEAIDILNQKIKTAQAGGSNPELTAAQIAASQKALIDALRKKPNSVLGKTTGMGKK